MSSPSSRSPSVDRARDPLDQRAECVVHLLPGGPAVNGHGEEGSGCVNRWVVGWAIGALVVVIAASLLVAIIALCRRIVRQAEDITRALDGARENSDALFDVTRTNAAIASISAD